MIAETVTARIRLALLCLLALTHLSGSLSAQPRVISGFGAATGPEGYPRREGAHQGVDLAAAVATSVIAPADGVVDRTIQDDLCGNGIVVSHGALATVYCHLSEVAVHAGQSVRRAEVLGRTGTTGLRPGPGFEHLHFEVRNGPTRDAMRLDPMTFIVGCFEPGLQYPTDRLVLTYPLSC
jgi:murein DD-endopeptidase MepM/ murein hydrolase activator NlpD